MTSEPDFVLRQVEAWRKLRRMSPSEILEMFEEDNKPLPELKDDDE